MEPKLPPTTSASDPSEPRVITKMHGTDDPVPVTVSGEPEPGVTSSLEVLSPSSTLRMGELIAGNSVEGLPNPAKLVEQIHEMAGASLETSETSIQTSLFDGKAALLTDVKLDGLSHISVSRIDEFTEDKARAETGKKFGAGTYFGLGELGGEAVGLLSRIYDEGDAYMHEASLTGNVVVMRREDVEGVHADLQGALGETSTSRVKRKFDKAPVTNLLERVSFDGQGVDAVVIMMDEAGKGAEVIIMPQATNKIDSKVGHKKGEPTIEAVIETPRTSEPRLGKDVFQEIASRESMPETIADVAQKVADGESPIDIDQVMTIEAMTSWSHIEDDLHRSMLVARFGEVMNQSVGVDEGYTLGEHTQMVLSIFETQFAKELFAQDPDKTKLIRTALLLQDIGKPLAVAANDGDRKTQTDYNHDVAQAYLVDIDLPEGEKALITELVGQDILGSLFKDASRDFGERGLGQDKAMSEVTAMAKRMGMPSGELLDMMYVMYVSDAGAYTSHARYMDSEGRHLRGRPSLDSVFEYDDATARLTVKPRLQRAFERLKASTT